MTAPTESRPRRLDIDGLRGLAVLLVVGFHAGVPWLRGAFLAVDVFFVLSGFFLGATLARRMVTDDDLDIGDLIARRIWRLLPAFVVVAVFTLVSAMLLYAPIDRPAVAENLIPVSFFVGNLAFAARGVNYFHATENPFLHTWTLGVEWQLVILLPLLVAWFARIGQRRARAGDGPQERNVVILDTVLTGLAIVSLLSFVASLIIGGRAPMWAYFSPITRLWPFALGAAAGILIGGGQSAIGSSQRRIGLTQLAGVVAIFAPALFAGGLSSYSVWTALPAVLGSLLLLSTGAAAEETAVGRVLASKPLVAIGRVSFAWYLWHLPLMVLGAALAPEIGVLGKLAWAVVGLALAMVTEKWIEAPARSGFVSRLLEERPLVTAAATFVAIAALATSALIIARRHVATTEHRAYAAAREDRVGADCWDDVERVNGCAFGSASSPTMIALLGDSHANHWLAGLDRAGKERGWRIEPYVKGGCPTSDFAGLAGAPKSDRYDKCHQFRDEAIRTIIARKPRAVLLSNYDSYIETAGSALSEYRVHEAAWTEGLRRTYARFTAAGIPVIVLRGTPRVPFDVPSCLSRRAARLPLATDCTYQLDVSHIARARSAQQRAARGLNVRFVDMQDQICASSPCPTIRDGVIVFTDDNHLTAGFTRSIGSVLAARMGAALSGPEPRELRAVRAARLGTR
ncbi:MAG TPA: acyltransferase family protein [Gemmatimonadaceae bacterium]